jgi:tRNA-specific 2-thiouridylase
MTKSASHKAVVLLSGGLDSLLAVLTMLRQGIRVSAIRFSTPFDTDNADRLSISAQYETLGQKWGFDITVRSLRHKMLDIVKTPKHGHGKNMNPCIDCRILMLKEAKQFMDMIDADFLVTGEVLGQRPMSQRRDMLYHIDKEAGVTDIVLRPLSAKLLRMTIPEQNGIVDREVLYAFSGRSRKAQMALAREFGLNEYPAPAGGCLLTEPNFALRLKDLLVHDPNPGMRDIDLLKTGRQFRFLPRCKIIVGRNKSENEIIESLAQENDCLLRVECYGSPTTLVTGEITDESLRLAAGICARYSDVQHLDKVLVKGVRNRKTFIINAFPASDEMIDAIRIEKNKTSVQAIA